MQKGVKLSWSVIRGLNPRGGWTLKEDEVKKKTPFVKEERAVKRNTCFFGKAFFFQRKVLGGDIEKNEHNKKNSNCIGGIDGSCNGCAGCDG